MERGAVKGAGRGGAARLRVRGWMGWLRRHRQDALFAAAIAVTIGCVALAIREVVQRDRVRQRAIRLALQDDLLDAARLLAGEIEHARRRAEGPLLAFASAPAPAPELHAGDARLAAQLLDRVALLPPTFHGIDWATAAWVDRDAPRAPRRLALDAADTRHNRLLAIRLTDAGGVTRYASPGAPADVATVPYAGAVTMTDGSTLLVALGTPLGDRIVAVAAPRAAHGWLIAALVALGALFLSVAFAELRRQRQLAEERRDFVAAVSHELRTPLASMSLLAETLLGPAAVDEAQRRRWLHAMHREARRLGRLVDNVILHVRSERPQAGPDRRWTDAGAVAREVLADLAAVAEARAVRLRAALPARCAAFADPDALRQVLLNLVDNAIKHGPEGQEVTVTLVAPASPGAALVLMVDDEGAGVPERDRRRIWRPFVRLGGRHGATGGSGLGLSVVRALVRQHGGRVGVRDAPGGGARFVVVLPQPRSVAPRPGAARAPAGPLPSGPERPARTGGGAGRVAPYA